MPRYYTYAFDYEQKRFVHENRFESWHCCRQVTYVSSRARVGIKIEHLYFEKKKEKKKVGGTGEREEKTSEKWGSSRETEENIE